MKVKIPEGRYVAQIIKVWPKNPDQNEANEADPWNVRCLLRLELPEGEDTVEVSFDIPARERHHYNRGDTFGLEGTFRQHLLPDGTAYRTATWSPAGAPDKVFGNNLFYVFTGTPRLIKRGVQMYGGECTPAEAKAFGFDVG
jgi:hypothetical protein